MRLPQYERQLGFARRTDRPGTEVDRLCVPAFAPDDAVAALVAVAVDPRRLLVRDVHVSQAFAKCLAGKRFKAFKRRLANVRQTVGRCERIQVQGRVHPQAVANPGRLASDGPGRVVHARYDCRDKFYVDAQFGHFHYGLQHVGKLAAAVIAIKRGVEAFQIDHGGLYVAVNVANRESCDETAGYGDSPDVCPGRGLADVHHVFGARRRVIERERYDPALVFACREHDLFGRHQHELHVQGHGPGQFVRPAERAVQRAAGRPDAECVGARKKVVQRQVSDWFN